MLATGRMLIFALSAVAASVSLAGSRAEPMSGNDLRALYSQDVTECGEYPDGAGYTGYCELWKTGGLIVGRSDTEYRGFYRILVSKAKVCVTLGTALEHCGSCESLGQNAYQIVFADGTAGVVTIVPGNTQGLELADLQRPLNPQNNHRQNLNVLHVKEWQV